MTIDDALATVRQTVREPVETLLGIPPAGRGTQRYWAAYQALCDAPLELVAAGWAVTIQRTPAGWHLAIATPVAGKLFAHTATAPSYAGVCSELAYSIAAALDTHEQAIARAAKRAEREAVAA